MIPVPCRAADDCGVACLATLAGIPWEAAVGCIWPKRTVWQFGMPIEPASLRTSAAMLSAAAPHAGYRVSPQRGGSELIGNAGFMFVRLALSEWESDCHWLAWERNESGVVVVFDPRTAELFEYKPGALHNRGMRLTYWMSIEPKRQKRGR